MIILLLILLFCSKAFAQETLHYLVYVPSFTADYSILTNKGYKTRRTQPIEQTSFELSLNATSYALLVVTPSQEEQFQLDLLEQQGRIKLYMKTKVRRDCPDCPVYAVRDKKMELPDDINEDYSVKRSSK